MKQLCRTNTDKLLMYVYATRLAVFELNLISDFSDSIDWLKDQNLLDCSDGILQLTYHGNCRCEEILRTFGLCVSDVVGTIHEHGHIEIDVRNMSDSMMAEVKQLCRKTKSSVFVGWDNSFHIRYDYNDLPDSCFYVGSAFYV